MGRAVHKVSTIARAHFAVYDTDHAPVTGLSAGDFTAVLVNDGATSAVSVTVAEVGSGLYVASYTPDETGTWTLVVRQATHAPRGWAETWDVTTDGLPSVADVQDGLATSAAVAALPTATAIADELLDRAAAVDGYTPRELARLMAAMLLGKVSGGPGSPVFRAADDSADRVAMTADASGNRTGVTLTP